MTIAVDDVEAINPATGEPYFFYHVTLGGGGGDGTVDEPLGSLAAALSRVSSDGNEIIYVDAGSNPGLGAFTLPSNVQLLSKGPIQLLNVRSQHSSRSGLVQLPGSGTGVFPTVAAAVGAGNGVVTLNSNSTLSGFNIQVLDGSTTGDGIRGILGRNVSNVTISNNTVSNAIGEGIYLNDVTGTVNIAGNTVNNTRNNANANFNELNGAILVNNSVGDLDLTITNNTVLTDFAIDAVYNVDGIEVSLCRTGFAAIYPGCTSTAAATVNIANNTVINSGPVVVGEADGIDINLNTNSQMTITIANNNVQAMPDKGISFGSEGSGRLIAGTITNNAISNTFGEGINVGVEGSSRFDLLTISGNQITNVRDNRGIDIQLANSAVVNLVLTNNTISNPFDDGVRLEVEDDASLFATVLNNTVTNSQDDDGFDVATNSSGRLCLRFEGNSATGSNDEDFEFDNDGSTFEIFGITTAIGNNAALQTALTSLGNTGAIFNNQTDPIAVATANCTFP
ncbi:MAG: hypothetical protein HC838_07865 [Spirulinaceae cyanobacterium RM2_2_10]|nr:hypothetical protein [Spirulinaceae cyanobacterium RM2_2_10]